MSVKIPEFLQEFIKGKPGWVATASTGRMPNIAIKGSLRVLDDEHLMFADLFSQKTRKNLEENPQVAVMVYDDQARKGYSLKGTVELISQGPLYDQTLEMLKHVPTPLPTPKYVVKITVESIFDQSIGPEGGKRIA